MDQSGCRPALVSRTPFIEMHNQMKTIHHTSYALAVLLLMATALAGCRDSFSDRDLPTPAPTETGAPDGTIEVRLPYAAPLMSTPTTLRGMSTSGESFINAFASRLFVFDSSDKLLYEAPISNITPVMRGQDRYLKGTVTAFLKEGDGLKLALYANLDPKQMKTNVTGMSRAEISKLFTFTLSTETPEILPMWGELDDVKVSHTLVAAGDDAVQTISDPIKMLRSVARIDVGLNLSGTAFKETSHELKGKVPSATGTTEVTYTLASVEVVNVSLSNTVAPHASVYHKTKNQVTGLYNGTSITHKSKLTYSTISKNVLLRDIYVAETPNPKSTTMKGDDGRMSHEGAEYALRPYLIIGLKHSLDKKVRYFRIDFLTSAKKDNADPEVTADGKLHYDYIDLLRNHRYLVNILKVDGLGYETKDEAAKYSAANIAYNVLVLDESKIGDVMYDGQHTLAVTAEKFSVGMYGSQPTYHVKTTWPGGWEIEVPEFIPGTTDKNNLYEETAENKSSWVKFETTSGPVNKISPVIQTILPNDKEPSVPRTGYFYVKAGRMRWLITIHQSNKADLAISLWQDPEATKPLQYVELHQHGLGLTPTAKDLKSDRPVETAGGYRRIYVKTDPYVDPNETTYFRDGFRPVLKRAGRDDVFYFWDYTTKGDMATESPDEATLTEASKATAGVPTSPWNQPSAGGDHRFFRYTGENNVWECIVTVERTKKPEDPFEYYTDLYDFSISDDSETTTARLTVSQVEYNVEPSDGPALRDRYKSNYVDDSNNETSVRYNAPFKPIFVLDGKEHHFYIAGNAPYKITLIDNPGGGITSFGTDRVYVDHDPDLRGEKVYFTTKKDNTLVDNQSYKARFRVESLNNLFSPYVFTIDLVSAIIQPEANTYMIKRGETQGILIPVSRVNTAADYYDKLLLHDRTLSSFPSGKPLSLNRLGPNDDFEPYVVWTDLGKAEGGDLSKIGIAELSQQGIGPSGYVYVRLNKQVKAGCALIAIRSKDIYGDPILWSWLLWVVDEYPQALTTNVKGGFVDTYWKNQFPSDNPQMPTQLKTMSHLIGAKKSVEDVTADDNYRDPDAYGYQFQFGRKDPFPSWKMILPMAEWPGLSKNVGKELIVPKEYYDGSGNRFYFELHTKGDRSEKGQKDSSVAAGSTMSMRESVENPETIVSHAAMWLYESTPYMEDTSGGDLPQRYTFLYLWNRVGSSVDRQYNHFVGKTVFDPSPYGWRIMNVQEAVHSFFAYKNGFLNSTRPSATIDGDYTALNNDHKGSYTKTLGLAYILYIAEGNPKQHAGMYLNNFTGTWNETKINGSLANYTYRRATAASVRPVINQEEPDYTKYLPGYGK